MTRIINMTPHAVRVISDNENVADRVFMPSGKSIRLESQTYKVGEIDGVPLTRTQYGNPIIVSDGISEELYFETPGVYYIVSAMVAQALPHRKDLLVPAEQVRDSDGKIIGCRSLGTIS